MTTDYFGLKSKIHEALPERLIEGHPTYANARSAFDEVAARYKRATAACAKSNQIAAQHPLWVKIVVASIESEPRGR